MRQPDAQQSSDSPQPIPATPPGRFCDVIMKGGITSGVVYPRAVCELARHYRFKNIGGTSAGAIAAAGLAAAEYRRLTAASADGFFKLAGLSEQLGQERGGRSFLASLFQPQPATRALFDLLLSTIKHRSPRRKAQALILALLRSLWPAAVLGALPAVLAIILLWHVPASVSLVGSAIILQALLLVLGAGAAVGVALWRRVATAIPANYFGLCTGLSTSNGVPALTTWLEGFLDDVAFGPSGRQSPLTFKDLTAAGTDPERGITLQMMTTNLGMGRPETLPRSTHGLWFRRSEFSHFFSPRIVGYLATHARIPVDKTRAAIATKLGLTPLPMSEDLPVVLAARMSLSFPLLLSALPLYTFDASYKEARVVRSWYSDGGITSNLPIHFFDSIIPRWPTFAFNLIGFHPDYPYDPAKECNNIWLPDTKEGGQQARMSWPDDDKSGGTRLFRFLGAMKETMQNWRDNLQVIAPGFRDRIAHIKLRPEEGGMNLTMPAHAITALGERGRCAATELVQRYGDQPSPGTQLTWDNHRWVRLRSALHLLHQKLIEAGNAYEKSQGARSYPDLATNPPSYQQISSATITRLIADLEGLLQSWGPDPNRTHGDVPDPQPDLRIGPRILGERPP